MVTTIYALRDPREDQNSLLTIRYIGKTISPLHKRLAGHFTKAVNPRSGRYDLWVARWIRTLTVDGVRPTISALERAADDWAEREAFWITYCREAGAMLTNLTAGGEGTYGRKATEEQRENCRRAAERRWSQVDQREIARRNALRQFSDPEQLEALRQRSLNMSSETIEKIRAAAVAQAEAAGSDHMKGMALAAWTDPDSRSRLLASRKQVASDPEFRKRVGEGVSLAWSDPDTRDRFMEGIRGRPPQSKASREQAAASNRGRTRSPEARARISAGCLAREARKRALHMMENEQ
ncbi:MAG TPA: hypothetical protein VNU68_35350 [Verrucomicrobiae bacterium]|nr:hypothetical protein [Verrucomicrobiae bacterium]